MSSSEEGSPTPTPTPTPTSAPAPSPSPAASESASKAEEAPSTSESVATKESSSTSSASTSPALASASASESGSTKVKLEEKDVEPLKKFIERINQEKVEYDKKKTPDWMLLCFLRARSYEMDPAFEMFSKSMKWRKEYKADTIIENLPKQSKYFTVMRDYWPIQMNGKDKRGVPLILERVGSFDINLVKMLPHQDLLEFHVYFQELVRESLVHTAEELGHPVFGNVFIEDLNGLGMKHVYTPGINLVQKMTQIDEANYPETLHRVFLLNAPKIFHFVWGMIVPFFDKKTVEKIKVFSNNFKTELLEYVEADNLFQVYGGNLTNDLKGGGDFECPFLTTVSISRGKKFKLDVVVEEDNMELEWQWRTKERDVVFSVYHKAHDKKKEGKKESKKEGKKNVAFEEIRTAENQSSVPCTKGTYVLIWDNSFSKMRSKEVIYWTFLKPITVVDEETIEQAAKEAENPVQRTAQAESSMCR